MPCWVVGKTKRGFKKKFNSDVDSVIVMPAFNPFFAGTDKEYFGVLNKFVKPCDIFLLDMTKVV
jgi:metallophosphoesterase superfamily enzyme